MIPANGAPHDLDARDVLRSLPFAQRRARDESNQSIRQPFRFKLSLGLAASATPDAAGALPVDLRFVIPILGALIPIMGTISFSAY
jgi:hypothetical protein